ncbi:MAG: hypothetical protein QMC17_08640, partial [Paracoccaceae bacterium]
MMNKAFFQTKLGPALQELPARTLTFSLGLLGGAIGYKLNLPMGLLLGSMGIVAIFAISGHVI